MNNLVRFHELAMNHKKVIESSQECGCFYCMTIFNPILIKEWVDDSQTALCPNCQIDAVLPQTKELIMTEKLLQDMHNYWFRVIA